MIKKEEMIHALKPLMITIAIFLISLVGAFNGYSSSPMDLLQNEWVIFGIIFFIAFGLAYYSLSKIFGENRAVAAVISALVSFGIAASLAQRVYLYNFVGPDIGEWIVIIAIIVGILLLLRAAFSLGLGGVFAGAILIWIVVHNVDIWDIVPSSLLNSNVDRVYQFLGSWIVLWAIVALALITLFMGKWWRSEEINVGGGGWGGGDGGGMGIFGIILAILLFPFKAIWWIISLPFRFFRRGTPAGGASGGSMLGRIFHRKPKLAPTAPKTYTGTSRPVTPWWGGSSGGKLKLKPSGTPVGSP